MRRNSLHPITRPVSTPLATAPWRSVAFLCIMCMVSLLSACGGGGGGGGGSEAAKSQVGFTISGTLSGLANGQTIDLSQGSDTLTLSADGTFKFGTLIPQGDGYEVKLSGAQPAWQSCSISNATGSAVSANVSNVAVSCVSVDMKATGKLNDTGINVCLSKYRNDWTIYVGCRFIDWGTDLWGNQQDGYFGRDADAKAGKLTKVGGGEAGFDFTKIGASGKVLVKQGETWSDNGTEAAGTQWDCVRDNVTQLVWEVKRNDANHLRHMSHRYSWYNETSAINGGDAGVETPLYQKYYWNTDAIPVIDSTCTGVADTKKCNTQSYVTAVNRVGLCGKTDWRLPTVDELLSLANAGTRTTAAIDEHYFPNTKETFHWSSSPDATVSANAWEVSFYADLMDHITAKNFANPVRLVRSGLVPSGQ